MSGERTPTSVLADIPGWEHASCRRMTGGQTNYPYLLEANGKRAVLKIDAEARALPYNSREDEGRVQAIAADRGLAARVLFVDDHVYMSEYIVGQVWTRADLDDEENLERLALALKKLHSLPLTGRTFDATVAMRRYLSDIAGLDSHTARQCAAIVVSRRAPQNLCCCHNDLVAGNIIATPELRFLDWEYACDNDPFFDIATVITHHDLSDQQADLLLDSYFDGDGARWRSQLQKQMHLYDALHWLWLAARSGAGENKEQLEAIARRLESGNLPAVT